VDYMGGLGAADGISPLKRPCLPSARSNLIWGSCHHGELVRGEAVSPAV